MEDNSWKILRDSVILIAMILLVAFCTSILQSCSPKTVYVPQEKLITRTDTVERVLQSTHTDTVKERVEVYSARYDSIAPILDSLNRVIGYDRWHFRETKTLDERKEARMQAEIDSLKQKGKEYIRKPYPVEIEKRVEVKKPLTWWQKTLMWSGAFLLTALLAFLTCYISKILKKS